MSSPVIVMPNDRVHELLRASLKQANEGRVYDYYRGGNQNYAVDRAFAEAQIAKLPSIPWAARQGDEWIFRTVRHMAASGIRQVVDFGCGLPNEASSHEVLERHTNGKGHVVYVDHDPMAAAHAHLILERTGKTGAHKVIQADIENHECLWEAILSTGVINPVEPVGLLMAASWHFVPDSVDPWRSVRFYRDAVPPGSQIALSHVTTDGMTPETLHALKAVISDYDDVTSQAHARSRTDIREFFGDWDLLEPPGLCWISDWYGPGDEAHVQVRGDIDSSRALMVGGLAAKP